MIVCFKDSRSRGSKDFQNGREAVSLSPIHSVLLCDSNEDCISESFIVFMTL